MVKIAELYGKGRPVISVELNPPRADDPVAAFDGIIAPLVGKIDYVSITNGAGGNSRGGTLDLAARAQNYHGITAMPHLACRWLSQYDIDEFVHGARTQGIESILALRGDPPKRGGPAVDNHMSYPHADGLVDHLARTRRGEYRGGIWPYHWGSPFEHSICVACYPEGHPNAVSFDDDIGHFKRKVELGADIAITQMVFDAAIYARFVDRCRREGITIPIIPGVFPLRSPKDISVLPSRFGIALPSSCDAQTSGLTPAQFKEWRDDFTASLIKDFLRVAPGVHIFGMNNTPTVLDILSKL